ncbi:tripartite tricarboxylate transporter substrate binding protein BugE [Pigmentiphaga soli]|uniref:Tripartite tricarboxylate transporter substrate binding protein BugE n=1 Tax=Pigmentiphaga soli TaxID=1007095 RepID=A0ABP8GMG7_9BURK
MTIRKTLAGVVAGIACLASHGAAAQGASSFPTRAIRIIVPFSPGASDTQIRTLGPLMSKRLNGQPIVVENSPGGGGIVGANIVRHAPPDGYTLFFTGAAGLTLLPALRADVPYKLRDFVAIGNVSSLPGVLVVRADAPYRTMAEIVAYARKHPGKINFGSAGVGTASHTFGVGPQVFGDFRFTHVPYKGMADVIQAILAGTVDAGFAIPGLVMPYLQAGKLRAIAVSSAKRSEFLPDVPTYREAGIDYVDGESYGLVGPKGVPPAIVKQVSDALAESMKAPEFVNLMQKLYTSVDYVAPGPYQEMLEARDRSWHEYLANPAFRQLMQQ